MRIGFWVNFMSALDFRAMLEMERAKTNRSLERERKGIRNSPDLDVATEDGTTLTPKGSTVEGLPDSVVYYPGFVTEEQECQITTEAHALASQWIQMDYRRVQNHGGTPTMDRDGMIETPLPDFLADLSSLLVKRRIFPSDTPPNHCLLNEYDPGMGIAPHMDGPRYLAGTGAAILSLNSYALIKFSRRDPVSGSLQLIGSVLLEPRSLIHFSGDAFTTVLHAIDSVREEVVNERDCLNLAQCRLAGVGVAGSLTGAMAGRRQIIIPRRTRLSVTLRAARTTPRSRELRGVMSPALSEELRRRSVQWIASIRDSARHFEAVDVAEHEMISKDTI